MVETLYDNAFTTHTYKHTTMGFLKDIENMPNEMAYSRQFFDRYYRPDNVVILVVGDADPETVFKLVEASATAPGKRAARARPSRVEPPQKKEKRAELVWKGPTLPMLLDGLSHARRSRRPTSICRRWTCWPSCCSPSARRSTRSW